MWISEKSKTMTPLSLKVPQRQFCVSITLLLGPRRERETGNLFFFCCTLRSFPFVSFSKGKRRVAHRPNSKPKLDAVLDLEEEDEEGNDGGGRKGVLTEEELWARLDELEKLEALQDEQDRYTLVVLLALSVIAALFFFFNAFERCRVFQIIR